MKTVLPLVTESQQRHIQEIVARIVELAIPEKIICYGVRSMTSVQWSSFSNDSKSLAHISIDLLIILQEKDKRRRESVSDLVENLSNDNVKLIPVVHSIDAVNINLEQRGNPFFTILYRNGVLVYDSNRIPFSIPSDEDFNETFLEANLRKSNLAQMFLDTANDCATEGRNDVAVFMLHQAMELTCIALLRTCLGYKPTTHSIKKLFALVENISLDVHLLFPRTSVHEIELFTILQRAYSDVRYKDSYSVSNDKVIILLERVHQFHAMAIAMCDKNRNKFKPVTAYGN